MQNQNGGYNDGRRAYSPGNHPRAYGNEARTYAYSNGGGRRFNDGPAIARMAEERIGEPQLIQGERKLVTITRRRNERGDILRIDEERGGMRNTIIIPAELVEDVFAAIDKLFPEAPKAEALEAALEPRLPANVTAPAGNH